MEKNELVKKIKEKITYSSDFIKNYYLIIIVGSYVLGTISLLVRNKIYSIPFQILSIQQYILLIIYWIMICISQAFINIPFVIVKVIRDKKFEINGNVKKVVIISCVLGYILINLFNIFVLSYIVDIQDKFFWIIIYIPLYVLFPIFRYCIVNCKIIRNVLDCIAMVYSISIIFFITINLGGYKALNVRLVTYDDFEINSNMYKDCSNEYEYFGIENGLYILKQRNKVFLIPIDSGYIEYNI